jgi:DNA polymerase alpha subunit B
MSWTLYNLVSTANLCFVQCSTSSQLDLRQAKHWQMKLSPDILVIPSKLSHLATDVMGTLVVNPGQLTKGSFGGTFAEMSIHPIVEEELRNAIIDSKGPMAHKVSSRTRVDILKI